MKQLRSSGLIPALKECVVAGIPLLGICVGLQVLFEGSEESEGIEGLGLLKGTIRKISAQHEKIPHMGWNALDISENHQNKDLFEGVPQASYVYFVHSYHAVPENQSIISSRCSYGGEITASISSDNILATQFHPEKSSNIGMQILHNFIHF